MSKNSLSNKEQQRREFILNGNLYSVVPYICIPLALYQGFNWLFKVIDNIMASHISSTTVSAVAYLSQVNQIILAIGTGLATGGSIIISRFYGAGNYDKVKRFVNSLFSMCTLISLVIMMMAPFSRQILRFFGTPEVLIDEGLGYFVLGLLDIIIIFFNTIYIAIERSRGNSKRILVINVLSMIIKVILTGLFVYVFNFGINMIAVAGIIANLFITIPGFLILSFNDSPFKFKARYWLFKKEDSLPTVKLGFPVITEKIAFAAGKIAVNSMSAAYGAETVGALGITNNISGIVTMLQNGFQEGCSSIISQNIGANKLDRALKTFRVTLLYNVIIGVVGYTLTMIFLPQLARLFAPEDKAFAEMICFIYQYEAAGIIPLGINATAMAFLYGFGYTKLTLCVNFCRVLVFRVPLLWIIVHFTNLGIEAMGIVMCVSNILVSIMSGIIVGVLYYKVKYNKISIDNKQISK
ncbi:MAG: MATE family efflux transporter [Spirochaetaceae bacterium]|nr:MATE family efflux transporter [Spirochaetaceae bacterium]